MAQRRRKTQALARTRSRRATGNAPAVSPVHGVLGKSYFPGVPREETQRPHFGRSVNLSMIDAAIRAANRGLMRRLTDLNMETIRLDAHASSLWQKRLNRLAALPWVVEAATGEGIDEQRAEDYAGFVRTQLEQIPNFRQCLMDLNTGHYHGRACSEVEWDLHRAVWRARDLHWLHPRRLSFGPDRDVRIIDLTTEIGNFEDQGFPVQRVPYKFVTFTPRVFGDYAEREGLAPRAVFWSFFARMGTRERLHLMEVWGKPWRIAYPELDPNNPTGVNQEQIDDAYDALNSLGGQATAVLPIAMKVLIPQPSKGAGDVHDAAIDHAEKSMSKLFVGATGTTDAVSTGLGSNIGDIHASEEDLLIAMDAFRLSETVESQLTDSIIVVNFGPDAVDHAPRFRLATDAPMDRKAETELLKAILDLGIDVSMAEVRERVGVREIKPGEAFLRRIPRLINGQPPFYTPMPEQVHPIGEHPDAGTIANVPTVEGGIPPVAAPPPQPPPRPGAPPQLPSGGAPPPQLPAAATTATDDDDPPADLSVAELAAKMTEHQIEQCQHMKKNRCWICGVERERDFDLGDDGAPVWHVKWRPIGVVKTEPTPEPIVATARKRKLAEPRLGYGDGGMHQHYVDREAEKLVLGGEHNHAFMIDGHLIYTELDGPHEHRDDEAWEHAGDHYHRLPIPGGGAIDTEIGGHHYHGKGVSVTGVDGAHTHVVKLDDGRIVQSLNVEELAEFVEDESEPTPPSSPEFSDDPAERRLRELTARTPETESARVEQAASIIETLAAIDPDALAAALLKVSVK